MFKNAIGLILADDMNVHLGDLSRPRALGAVPFGGRYRIIDFSLSNMVNTGIYTVGVSTYFKYRSLMDHLGTGSQWDLDRMNQGLHILPPNVGIDLYNGSSYDLAGIWDFYRDFKQSYVVITTCQCIYNTTYDDIIEAHIQNKADMTILYNNDGNKYGTPNIILDFDRKKKVKGVYYNPEKPVTNKASMGLMVMSRELFNDILSNMISQSIKEEIMHHCLNQYRDYNIYGYEYKGEVIRINSLQSYFNESMRALSESCRSGIFYGENPIYTKVKDEAPTYYNSSCDVSNSLISDGCTIMGTVKDSLLFRNVTIEGQASVQNCILFQDTFISKGCQLENVIIDKNAVIRPGTRLIGNPNYPIVIGKGAIV